MKSLLTRIVVAAVATASASGQQSQPLVGETATQISDHVWAIMGFPNIAIVVGSHATLVVDTGLGPKNGATAARVAAKLAPGNTKIFLTTTHFHPEHAAGEAGFPAGTVVIRNAVQQQEMEKHGQEMIDLFSGRSAQNKDLLAGVVPRLPDVTFDQEAKVDLGGVTARLLWFGGAHTKGDELVLVEPDRTIVTGDVVQNKVVPNIFGDGGTPASWLAVLDRIASLNVAHVLPDHSPPGDGTLVAGERDLIIEIRTLAVALRRQGVAAAEAGKQVTAELKTRHPDSPNTNAAGFVNAVYAEPE